MGRSIVAVIVGFMAWSVLWVGTQTVLQKSMPETFQPDGHVARNSALALILAVSVVCSLVAGYITAVIRRSLTCVVWLGVLLLAVGIFVQSQYWNVMPLWYHLSFLVLLIPASRIGGSLRRG